MDALILESIIYFFLAGVDIFDGLTWLRYFFEGYDTYYVREYEFRVNLNELSKFDNVRVPIIKNNITQLNRLRNDLSYLISTGDKGGFEANIRIFEQMIAEVK